MSQCDQTSRMRLSVPIHRILDRMMTDEYAMGRALGLSMMEICRNVLAMRDDFWRIAECAR